MNFKDFKAGHRVQQYQYQSFSPSFVNHDWTWDDPHISTLLEQATRAIGELNAFSLIVPNVDLFIRMHVLKEANTSSRIERAQLYIKHFSCKVSGVFFTLRAGNVKKG